MTFSEWFFGVNDKINPGFDNPSINMQWKLPHILVLVTCIVSIIAIALLFRRRSLKQRRIVIWILAGVVLFFEVTRRIKGLSAMCITKEYDLNSILNTLFPRPWCAISCWAIIISTIFNKKYLYNITSITAFLCALIFFAYPSAGFNNQFIEFENLYSIASHALLLISSISFITLKFTDFRYKDMWKDLICLAVIFAYACFEMFVLKIADNPLYFLPMADNEIQNILGVDNASYVLIYFFFVAIFVNIFYFIQDRKRIFKKRSLKKKLD